MQIVASGSLKRRLLSGSAWAVLLKGLGTLLSLAAYALLARLLPQDQFGAYLLMFSVVSFLAILIQGGMNKTAIRLIAESLAHGNRDRAVHAFRTTFRLVLLVGLAITIVWMLGINDLLFERLFNSSQMSALAWLTACWFLLYGIIQYFSDVFRATQNFFKASLFQGPATAIVTSALFGFYYLSNQTINLQTAVTTTVAATLAVAMAAALMQQRQTPLFGTSRLVPIHEVLPIAGPILITNLFVFISNQADLWILGAFLPKDEVAIYGAALRTVLLISIAPLIINSVVQPMIVDLYSKGEKERLEKLLGATAMVTFIPALLILLLVVFVGDGILALVFGQQYADGALILAILCAGRTISIFTGSCGQCLMLGGHQRILMTTAMIFASCSILASALVVKSFGSVGVATCFAVGMTLQNITHTLLVQKRMGVSTFASLKWMRRVPQ